MMYGDFLKSIEEEEPKPKVLPPEPPTAKKRHVLGRSSGRIEPLRIDEMLPELNQLINSARKDRRSHEPSSSTNDSHERFHNSNTIPETLNSSRERNSHVSCETNPVPSVIPSLRIIEATPVKGFQLNYPLGMASAVPDKENLFTPQKASESAPPNTPAQLRCPLSVLPIKDSSESVDAPMSGTKSLQNYPGCEAEKNLFGSVMVLNSSNHDAEAFRTPQCKMPTNQQSCNSQGTYRQRLFGISNSKFGIVPLHPAVAAGLQQEKHLQEQRHSQAQGVLSKDRFSSRKADEGTPYKSVPTSQSSVSKQLPFYTPSGTVQRSNTFLPGKLPCQSVWQLPPKDAPLLSNQQQSNPPQLKSTSLELDVHQVQKKPETQQSGRATVLDSVPSAKFGTSQNLMHPPSQPAEGVSSSPPQSNPQMPLPSSDGANDQEKRNVINQVQMPVEPGKAACGPGMGQVVVNGQSYTILSLLGRGGSSKVFQVLDPVSSQLKAVKCVNLAETDPSICQGYLNEIKLLAELQDGDCVIRMFDHEHQEQKRLLCVVMEKGDTDLSKLIKDVARSKKISAAMIVYYWTEMLNAVNFIHKHGIIHSDLKPANFLLVSGRLKLIDFGIASSVQEDMTSVVKDCMTGTYNYISPEALSNTSSDGQQFKISFKSDVWSLGCILYNLVYGRTPFQHIVGQFQKMNAIVNPSHKIQFPDPPIEGCPSALIQAMKVCLVRNPKDRPSVEELLQLPYHQQSSPEREILSQIASLVASVGYFQESEDNRLANTVRAIQRLLIENERNLPFLGNVKS